MPEQTPNLDGLSAESFCYLTTTGRVTGRPHEIEIWFSLVPETRTLYMLAGNGDSSDWVKNLRLQPAVTVGIADEGLKGKARVVEDAGEDGLARRLLVEKYERRPGSLSGWGRRSLPVAVDLD
jgi:deazaflavin-dependent oxidoreductase (nitroreductase family)